MNTYLFSDNEHFQVEIKASTAKGALMKARTMFGIRVPLRLNQQVHNLRQYRNGAHGYGCHIVGPV
jgi:hypothetical protein